MTSAMQQRERRESLEARKRFSEAVQAARDPLIRILKEQEIEIKRLLVENERLKGAK